MNKDKTKIGFIGAGYIGYGMALNLINNYDLTVFAHKNRKPIDDLVQKGAKEVANLEELAILSNVIIMCVTNTRIAIDIIDEIAPHLQKKTMIIDITTHKADGSIQIFQKLNSLDIMYVESPVMGGPVISTRRSSKSSGVDSMVQADSRICLVFSKKSGNQPLSIFF